MKYRIGEVTTYTSSAILDNVANAHGCGAYIQALKRPWVVDRVINENGMLGRQREFRFCSTRHLNAVRNENRRPGDANARKWLADRLPVFLNLRSKRLFALLEWMKLVILSTCDRNQRVRKRGRRG